MEKLKFRSSPTQNPITTGKSTSPYLHNFLKVSFNLLGNRTTFIHSAYENTCDLL